MVADDALSEPAMPGPMSAAADRRAAPAPGTVTLGILAGGRGSRLGGVDKAWLRRGGIAQVRRIANRFAPRVEEVLVSANRDLPRYAAEGLRAVPDLRPGLGPIGGLDALSRACATPWLLTLPVDIVDANDCLLPSLAAAGGPGAFAEDDDGAQPLAALWALVPLRAALGAAIASGDLAVHTLQRRLGMAPVRLAGVRLGNLNTPADLRAAGAELPEGTTP